ncbi:MAG TPA: hypothetical protein VGS19_15520 [Streptosporangiaceae bacterium]|nr:hypothetical protein [Streptosporangiaceae bacterium]
MMARLRKILWTLYWRGNAQLRERIEDELRPPQQPKVKPKKELPAPDTVLDEVTAFVKLAKDGAYMAGDRRVHCTERSRWRLTFRRLVGDALAVLQADDPGPAQKAAAKMVDLACDMKSYDYFHSDDPVEAAKFVVSDAVAMLWESVLRHDGFAGFARRVPEQLIRWESDHGWTRRGYGQVPERRQPWAFRSPGCSLHQTCGGRSVSPTWTRWVRPDERTRAARAPCTEVSTRLATGATSAPRTSQLGTGFFSIGSREPPRMICWTG